MSRHDPWDEGVLYPGRWRFWEIGLYAPGTVVYADGPGMALARARELMWAEVEP